MHRLYIRRWLDLRLSINETAELTGISSTTIRQIESNDKEYKVNSDTAKALAHGLDVDLHTLFDPEELSHLGRPPTTGKPIGNTRTRRQNAEVCPTCQVEIPRACGTECPTCDA